VYNGLVNGEKVYDHQELYKELKKYLDSTLKTKGRPLSADWIPGFNKILDKNMGPLPQQFVYNTRKYTPQSFAKTALKFNADDYVNITSFTHHPFYSPFILEVPDNFSNGAYFNIPLNEMIDLVKNAVNSGYTVLWDADVSNNGFNAKKGMALNIKADENVNTTFANPDFKEEAFTQNTRQQLFENLTTQDDHLMHIVGIEKSKEGKTFFIVKNSWGETGPFGGYVHVSEAYFAVNTISLVVPKAAMNKVVLDKLKIGK
jgi:bleomycin hydrolase